MGGNLFYRIKEKCFDLEEKIEDCARRCIIDHTLITFGGLFAGIIVGSAILTSYKSSLNEEIKYIQPTEQRYSTNYNLR